MKKICIKIDPKRKLKKGIAGENLKVISQSLTIVKTFTTFDFSEKEEVSNNSFSFPFTAVLDRTAQCIIDLLEEKKEVEAWIVADGYAQIVKGYIEFQSSNKEVVNFSIVEKKQSWRQNIKGQLLCDCINLGSIDFSLGGIEEYQITNNDVIQFASAIVKGVHRRLLSVNVIRALEKVLQKQGKNLVLKGEKIKDFQDLLLTSPTQIFQKTDQECTVSTEDYDTNVTHSDDENSLLGFSSSSVDDSTNAVCEAEEGNSTAIEGGNNSCVVVEACSGFYSIQDIYELEATPIGWNVYSDLNGHMINTLQQDWNGNPTNGFQADTEGVYKFCFYFEIWGVCQDTYDVDLDANTPSSTSSLQLLHRRTFELEHYLKCNEFKEIFWTAEHRYNVDFEEEPAGAFIKFSICNDVNDVYKGTVIRCDTIETITSAGDSSSTIKKTKPSNLEIKACMKVEKVELEKHTLCPGGGGFVDLDEPVNCVDIPIKKMLGILEAYGFQFVDVSAAKVCLIHKTERFEKSLKKMKYAMDFTKWQSCDCTVEALTLYDSVCFQYTNDDNDNALKKYKEIYNKPLGYGEYLNDDNDGINKAVVTLDCSATAMGVYDSVRLPFIDVELDDIGVRPLLWSGIDFGATVFESTLYGTSYFYPTASAMPSLDFSDKHTSGIITSCLLPCIEQMLCAKAYKFEISIESWEYEKMEEEELLKFRNEDGNFSYGYMTRLEYDAINCKALVQILEV